MHEEDTYMTKSDVQCTQQLHSLKQLTRLYAHKTEEHRRTGVFMHVGCNAQYTTR